jgi:hypothetical protein
MFETISLQNVSHILGMAGCGSSKEMKGLVTKRVPGGLKMGARLGDSTTTGLTALSYSLRLTRP